MASQIAIKKTAKQYQIEERRKQVATMIAQGMTEVEISHSALSSKALRLSSLTVVLN